MIPNKSHKYFVSVSDINTESFDINSIDSGLLASTPYLSLINFMKIKYDTHLGKDKLFRVSDEYSDNIYNYRINVYKIKDSYLKFISEYPDTSQAIFVKVNDKVEPECVIEPITDNAIFLKEELNKYGIDIVLIDKKMLFENTKEQQQKAIKIIDEIADDTNPSDSFFRSFDIFDSDIILDKIIPWSYDAVIGEYDLSEIKDMDRERASKILNELVYKVNKSLSKEYYIEIRNIDTGYGIIVLRRVDMIKENTKKNNNLWGAIFESEQFCNIGFNIRDIYYNDVVECIDLTHIVNNMYDREIVTESKKVFGGEYTPVYIVLTNTGSMASEIIKKFTKAPYNHASISFDPDINTLYSFSSVGEFNRPGFNIETIKKSYLDKHEKVRTQIYTVFVNQSQLRKMNAYIDNTIANYKKARYNFVGLMGYLLRKPLERENRKFCSEFVDEIFKLVDIDITKKKSGLVQPYDFANSISPVIFKVYEGYLDDINPGKINTTISRIFKNNKNIITEDMFIYNEAKSFPVQFDKDGNILIKNMKKIKYQTEYDNSHRLLGLYEKDKNIEGIKFELSKLWFINSLIEAELYSRKRPSQNQRKKLLDIRARVLNDFHKYIGFVNKYDSSFNFSEYYDETPFSDAEIKIYKDTIMGIGKFVKSMANLI